MLQWYGFTLRNNPYDYLPVRLFLEEGRPLHEAKLYMKYITLREWDKEELDLAGKNDGDNE